MQSLAVIREKESEGKTHRYPIYKRNTPVSTMLHVHSAAVLYAFSLSRAHVGAIAKILRAEPNMKRNGKKNRTQPRDVSNAGRKIRENAVRRGGWNTSCRCGNANDGGWSCADGGGAEQEESRTRDKGGEKRRVGLS